MQIKFRFDKYFDAPDREFFSYLAQQKNIADLKPSGGIMNLPTN
jgi:hypothetical protein